MVFLGLAYFIDAARVLAFLDSNMQVGPSRMSITTDRKFRFVKDSATQLFFGIPSFLTPPSPNDDENGKGSKSIGSKKSKEGPVPKDKSVGLKGLVQLIMAGAGAPFLGDYEGVDKETGKFMFSLEANNLVDEDGKSKQTAMPYFENGWVDPADLEREEQRKQKGGFKLPW